MESATELLQDRERRPADADDRARPENRDAKAGTRDPPGLARMQRSAGNAAVRLMVQRSVAAAPRGKKPAPQPLSQVALETSRDSSEEQVAPAANGTKSWAPPPDAPRGAQR